MTLSEKINNTNFIYFSDPIAFGGPYNQNHIGILRESDHDYFIPYIKAARKGNNEEVKSLTKFEHDRLFMFESPYHYVVDDKIIADHKKLDKLFRTNHYIIIGPEVNFSDGTYKHIEGGCSLRLDIFGNKVEKVDYKFMYNNYIYLADTKYYQRHFYIKAKGEEDSDVEDSFSLTVLPKKLKGLLIGLYKDEDGDYYDDVSQYFNSDGNIDEEEGIFFVEDLDDNDEIEEEIKSWLDEYMPFYTEGNIKVICKESTDWGIQYINPLDFEIN